MKKIISQLGFLAFLFLIFAALIPVSAQQAAVDGAWRRQTTDEENRKVTQVLLIADGFFTWTEYLTADGDFVMTKGGSMTREGNNLTLAYEFHTADADAVGSSEALQAKAGKKKLTLQEPGGDKMKWKKIDAGASTPLTGAWLFSGRKRDGELQRRDTNQPRKTMKILTGKRFQWIAYNTESGEFFGTGGGEYTAQDGKYTENILFFSRDKDRVGASLEFNFDVQGEDWHHSGFSSSGNPMYEIWTKRH